MAISINSNLNPYYMDDTTNKKTTLLEVISNNTYVNKININDIDKNEDETTTLNLPDIVDDKLDIKIIEQSIKNINNQIGMAKILDKAIDTQYDILDLLRYKTTQIAQDDITNKDRENLQKDISELLVDFQKVSQNNDFNSDKIDMSILDIKNSGSISYMTSKSITNSGELGLILKDTFDRNILTTNIVNIGYEENQGINLLADEINKYTDQTNIKASWQVATNGSESIQRGTITGLNINDIEIGDIAVGDNDFDNNVVDTINQYKEQTGVIASKDENNILKLESIDGRGIKVSSLDDTSLQDTIKISSGENYGKLTIQQSNSYTSFDIETTGDIALEDTFDKLDQATIDANTIGLTQNTKEYEIVVNQLSQDYANSGILTLSNLYNSQLSTKEALASGMIANSTEGQNYELNMFFSDKKETYNIANDLIDNAENRLDLVKDSIRTMETQESLSTIKDYIFEIGIEQNNSQSIDFQKESEQFDKTKLFNQEGDLLVAHNIESQDNVIELLQLF
jgi:flagellin